MSDLTNLSAAELAEKLKASEVSSKEVTQAHLDRIEVTDGQALEEANRAAGKSGLNAFLHTNAEEALQVAAEVDKARAAGEELPELAGVPIAIG